MRPANAHDVTVGASLAVVGALLDRSPPSGFTTPPRSMGRDFASRSPGSSEMQIA